MFRKARLKSSSQFPDGELVKFPACLWLPQLQSSCQLCKEAETSRTISLLPAGGPTSAQETRMTQRIDHVIVSEDPCFRSGGSHGTIYEVVSSGSAIETGEDVGCSVKGEELSVTCHRK